MEVKMIKQMSVLPKVFLTPDLVKHATTWNYLDCAKYVSKDGRYIYGCIEYLPNNNEKVREVRGIYYKPGDPIISIQLKKRMIYSLDDIMEFVKSLDNLALKNLKRPILFVYDNNSLYGYINYHKGRIYEFPLIFKQGKLSIYLTPEPPDLGIEDRFEKYKELQIYNHKITADQELKVYRIFYNKAGRGELIVTNQTLKLTIESPEYGTNEIMISPHTWFLISHPKPKKEDQS